MAFFVKFEARERHFEATLHAFLPYTQKDCRRLSTPRRRPPPSLFLCRDFCKGTPRRLLSMTMPLYWGTSLPEQCLAAERLAHEYRR